MPDFVCFLGFHLVKDIYFPLFVLKGIYDWICFSDFQGTEANGGLRLQEEPERREKRQERREERQERREEPKTCVAVSLVWVQLPSGAPISIFLGEGFPFKLNQPKKDALFSHGRWASVVLRSQLVGMEWGICKSNSVTG